MKKRSFTFKFASIPALLVASVLSATAVPFDFYKLDGDPAQPGDFPATNGIFDNGDIISAAVNGNLEFTNGGITATVTTKYTNPTSGLVEDSRPVQDHETGWTLNSSAGLGVYKDPIVGSDDNITEGEELTVTWDQLVNVSSIGLRNDGHSINWDGSGTQTFLLNGVSTLLPDGVNGGLLATPGLSNVTSFTVAYGGANPDQFYLASSVATVPDGGATLALFGISLMGLSFVRRHFFS